MQTLCGSKRWFPVKTVAAFAALVCWACALGLPCRAAAQEATELPLATVQVASKPGREIPANFMGFSHEWGNARWFLGSSRVGENRIYRQLLANLTAYGSGPIVLRIGGNSTDATREPTTDFILPFVDLARSTGSHFLLGVNLGAGDPELAARQAQLYLAQMPPGSVDEIEIGNEPDLYYRNGKRKASYSAENYHAEFDQWVRQLTPLLPAGVKLAGPGWGTGQKAKEETRAFEARFRGSLGVFTMHYYETNPGAHPGPDELLSPRAATDGPELLAPAVAISHSNGIPFRMGEFSSIGNEGVHGVSDDFATALWAVDTMFEYLRAGVDGVNWEASDGNFDSPFYFDVDQARRPNVFTLKYVSPLYYGLLFFQAATGHHARLLPVTVEAQANVKVWATLDDAGVERVVVLNKDLDRGGIISISLAGSDSNKAKGFTHGFIRRLTAPTPESTDKVRFAGQTFDGSRDGAPLGQEQVEPLTCKPNRCLVSVAAASGALITLQR
jgi:hypothetical protein